MAGVFGPTFGPRGTMVPDIDLQAPNLIGDAAESCEMKSLDALFATVNQPVMSQTVAPGSSKTVAEAVKISDVPAFSKKGKLLIPNKGIVVGGNPAVASSGFGPMPFLDLPKCPTALW
eukprot:NODE_12733_length_500_cov_8.790451_g12441_i0.p2 GENE.NODE_12733_length_500_cov_8.790451_g12441_i0~~NODE_12733_length_500_cov_8.790451_g12441_i0.p2  ORF type:complete len:118 (-),score=19.12 NODE_12733_length_500_cov_8.790451_g12441_i0:104-457(-)